MAANKAVFYIIGGKVVSQRATIKRVKSTCGPGLKNAFKLRQNYQIPMEGLPASGRRHSGNGRSYRPAHSNGGRALQRLLRHARLWLPERLGLDALLPGSPSRKI